MAQRLNIALLIETSNAYARGLLRGIRAYMHENRSWSIYVGEHTRGEVAPKWLSGWKGDGIIARVENQAIADAVLATGLPVIDVSAARLIEGVPFVETEDQVIAQMGAEHLLSRGFSQFAFCGVPQFMWSQNRCEEFERQIELAGQRCEIYPPPGHNWEESSWESDQKALGDWLERIPKPVGVMAAYDIRGRQVLDACRARGIEVPYEVAVLGVDDDELICDLADPPLSSIIPDTHRTGYEAARLLDRIMDGEEVEPCAYLIPPLGIATRQSSDVLEVEDPIVAMALRYIRDNALKGIKVEDVVDHLRVSRRVLESRMKQLTRRTPHKEIQRIQIDRVKQLLTQTDLSLELIAERCGFKHTEYMSVVFKRHVGITPGKFRSPARAGRGRAG